MKNNSFERTILVLILAAVIYTAVIQSKKTEQKTNEYYQLLPYKEGSTDTTASGGSGGKDKGPRLKADTVIIFSNTGLKKTNDCPCCQTMYAMSLTGTDTTHGGKGPHFLLIDLSAADSTSTDTTNTKKPPHK